MANRAPDLDDDDDFSEIYKEYTGPLGSNAPSAQDRENTNKRPSSASDGEEEAPDPNAVPTDFTSREAKVWEAKSKATERNWKKRKEEEMICKICGESGHFTQGCPSTLGANRKSQDFFQRVPAREKHIKALFSEKVISNIEKDIGCKIKMDEKFIIVSGKDGLILSKGVDAVHKMIEDGSQRGLSSSHRSRSRSPERSPVGSRFQRSDSQRSQSGPRGSSDFQQRFGRQEKGVEDRVRDDILKFPRGSPQARAYGSDGARVRPSYSRSPGRHNHRGNSHNSYDGQNQGMNSYKSNRWDTERRGSEMQSSRRFEYSSFPETLEELEIEFKKEALELARIRDQEEDEENCKHREALKDLRESYLRKLAVMRNMHAKEWEEFLQLDAQRRQQQTYQQQLPSSGFGGYKHQGYSEYDGSPANPHFSGTSLPMDSMRRNPNAMENYPSRSHYNFRDFQRQRRNDFGRTYNRY